MKIEHVALYLDDLEAGRTFFETYMGATAGALYHNPRTGLRSYFLTFDKGARLEIMQKAGIEDTDPALERRGFTHLAFAVGSSEEVDALTARLTAAGYEVASGPRTTGDGYYESCVLGPEGVRLEITV